MSNKEVGCLRRHNLARWHGDKAAAKATGNDKTLKVCWDCKNMELEQRVDDLSKFMGDTFGYDLDTVTSSAIEPYISLPEKTKLEKEFKYKILECVVFALKNNVNPVNGRPFNKDGLTAYIVTSIIRWKRSGHKTPLTVEIKSNLTPTQIKVLDKLLMDAEEKQLDDGSIVVFTTIRNIRKRLINQRVKDTCKGEY